MNLAMGSPLYSRIIFIAQPRILSSSMWNRTFVTGLSFQMTPSESWCLSCPIWVSFGSMLKRLGMNNMADYVTFICHWGATGTVISLLADASSVSAAYAKIEADYWLILCCIFMKGYIIYNHSAFKGKKNHNKRRPWEGSKHSILETCFTFLHFSGRMPGTEWFLLNTVSCFKQ